MYTVIVIIAGRGGAYPSTPDLRAILIYIRNKFFKKSDHFFSFLLPEMIQPNFRKISHNVLLIASGWGSKQTKWFDSCNGHSSKLEPFQINK